MSSRRVALAVVLAFALAVPALITARTWLTTSAALTAPTAAGASRLLPSAEPKELTRTGAIELLHLLDSREARRFDRAIQELGRRLAATTVFRVGTLNLLGHSHTAPGGNRHGWDPSRVRMARAMRVLDRTAVDVVGFQEFQGPQFRRFRLLTGRDWAAYPALRLGPRPVQNSVAWRTDVWRLDRARTIPVPYFFGRIMRMPAVQLRNRATGRRVWFVNVHNPADVFGPAGGWRAQATELEGELVRRLHATGFPVVLTGDFNDRAGAFCAIATKAPVLSADGGTTRKGCVPPADPAIDWIIATQGVELSGYVRSRGPLLRRTTDHPLVYATARIRPRARGVPRAKT